MFLFSHVAICIYLVFIAKEENEVKSFWFFSGILILLTIWMYHRFDKGLNELNASTLFSISFFFRREICITSLMYKKIIIIFYSESSSLKSLLHWVGDDNPYSSIMLFVCIINAKSNLCVYEFLSCFCHCYGAVLHPVKPLFPTKSYFCEMVIMINAFHFFILWTPIFVRQMISHKKKTSFSMSWWKYKLYIQYKQFFFYNMNKSIWLCRTQFLL